jgi:asparagine synthase (glutamine-hydrolysing)
LSAYGDDAPSRAEGPLSWVAWDASRGRLTAVRDRLGVEPLYYAERGERVAVGPRPAELLRSLGLPASPDLAALTAHLNGQAPPAGHSFLAGVSAVSPGTAVHFEADATRERRYWRLEVPPTLCLGSDSEYAEALRELLAETARDHLVDGAAVSMSGGLDSTAVAAMLRAAAPAAGLTALHRTAPEIAEADESAFARAAAERLGLRYETVRADRHWPLSSPAGLVTCEDSPLLPPYVEAWEASWSRARELGVGTVYTGAGGDHLFGGSRIYPYADLLLRGRWGRL